MAECDFKMLAGAVWRYFLALAALVSSGLPCPGFIALPMSFENLHSSDSVYVAGCRASEP